MCVARVYLDLGALLRYNGRVCILNVCDSVHFLAHFRFASIFSTPLRRESTVGFGCVQAETSASTVTPFHPASSSRNN